MIVVYSYLALILLAMVDNARGPLYPTILEHFQVSPFEGSLFFTLSSISALLTSLMAHRWLKRITPFTAIQLAILFISLGAFIMGGAGQISTPGASRWYGLLLGSLFLGIGLGGTTISMNILVTEYSPIKFQRALLTGLHSVYALSSFCTPFIINWLLEDYNWWNYFYLMSLLPLFLILYMQTYKKKPLLDILQLKQKHSNTSFNERFPFGAFLGLCVVAEVCISSRLVFYLIDYVKLSSNESNKFLSLFFICLFIGRLFGTMLPKTLSIKKLLFLALVFAGIFLGLGLTYSYYFLSFFALPVSLIFPFTILWVSQEFPLKRQFLITSMLNFVGVFLIMMHFLFGLLTSYANVQRAMLIPLVAIIMALYFWRQCCKKIAINQRTNQ